MFFFYFRIEIGFCHADLSRVECSFSEMCQIPKTYVSHIRVKKKTHNFTNGVTDEFWCKWTCSFMARYESFWKPLKTQSIFFWHSTKSKFIMKKLIAHFFFFLKLISNSYRTHTAVVSNEFFHDELIHHWVLVFVQMCQCMSSSSKMRELWVSKPMTHRLSKKFQALDKVHEWVPKNNYYEQYHE